MQSDRERCLAAGMDDYLTKPIKPTELAEVLARWVPRPPSRPGGPMTDREPILDLGAVLESVGGDRDLLDELAGTFAEEVPGWVAALRSAISSGDSQTLYRVAHGVNGAVGYFKAPRVRQLQGVLAARAG